MSLEYVECEACCLDALFISLKPFISGVKYMNAVLYYHEMSLLIHLQIHWDSIWPWSWSRPGWYVDIWHHKSSERALSFLGLQQRRRVQPKKWNKWVCQCFPVKLKQAHLAWGIILLAWGGRWLQSRRWKWCQRPPRRWGSWRRSSSAGSPSSSRRRLTSCCQVVQPQQSEEWSTPPWCWQKWILPWLLP